MGQLERLRASLWLRMTIGAGKPTHAEPDRLLTAEEVAERLGVKTGYVYRNAIRYPFMVREGRYIRFSEQGLSKYLSKCQRQG
jgi:excisionase family DNA binding protein